MNSWGKAKTPMRSQSFGVLAYFVLILFFYYLHFLFLLYLTNPLLLYILKNIVFYLEMILLGKQFTRSGIKSKQH